MNADAMTGRDGAIDFATKTEHAKQAVNTEDHIYRVVELGGT